ncbi:glycosyltransferase family 39 protein [Micromonospora sp. WMMD882]|uniref:glycosyltransferase family 39 protein n=1 Tax=Micromonospora sp. WMMD882 TaxID=3015151 RepID=UPI00248CE14A|nr:glycosyltransferase family 39 protein [Micromonospora sp. WMMD882]WBB79388.1 glycosyltransferase family 39 protein [Micromonospora sp. WMMD882]
MVGESDASDDPRWGGPVGRAGWWLWPALLALVVGAAGVGHAQPWRDELATWSAAGRPLPDLARLVGAVDASAGPYYLLAHGWTAVFGDSVTALRAPSVLAMAGAAGLTAVLGGRLFGRRAGLLGGLLFAALPGTSRYGQEARPYALVTLFAVAATLALVSALRRPDRAHWAAYAITVTALGLAHLVAVTLLAAHALMVLGGPDRGRWRRWLLALTLPAVALTPLALLARGQRARQLSWVDPARLGELPGLPGSLAGSAAVGGLLVGLALVGAARPARRRWGLLMLAAAGLPAALLFAAGVVTAVWVPRYLVFTTPFLCLPAGALLTSVRLPAALAVLGVTALLGLPAQLDLRRTHDWPRSAPVDYRGAARIVAAGQRPGDAIVYSPRDGFLFLDIGLAYHLGPDRPRDVLVTRDQRQAGDLWAVECDRPARCLTGVNRVWLVVADQPTGPLTDPVADPVAALPAAKEAALRDGFSPTGRWTVPGVSVTLLVRAAD